MTDFILQEEASLRIGAFLVVLCVMAMIESLLPTRNRLFSRLERWPQNLGIVVVDTAFMRLVLPLLAVDVALAAEARGAGLFNFLELSGVFQIFLSIVLLDLVVYWQHRVFHRIPVLWRLHRVHHTDRDFDTTTALRFHPFEIVLSMAVKMAVVLIFGVPAVAVILFEVVLNAMALFNHSNISLSLRLEPWFRRIVVTPDMHRIHHSIHREEFDTNFGFNLSLWDRMFSSYCEEPRDGHEGMMIGQPDHQSIETRSLVFMLMLPFRKGEGT